jgi:beta-glucuronidase
MSRFAAHDIRDVTSLNGIWDFTFLGDMDPDLVNPQTIQFADHMAVPGCFDATPALAGKRGLAVYRTRLMIVEAVPYRLVFQSVHHWCRVFVNGQALKDHAGGFNRFQVDLPVQLPGPVELVVLVDNRFNSERSLDRKCSRGDRAD